MLRVLKVLLGALIVVAVVMAGAFALAIFAEASAERP